MTNLNGLPDEFNVNPNPFNPGIGGVGGCVFGEEGGSGVCFDDAFQSIDSSNFRIRGANILFSGGRGPWSMGLGAGYAQRRYLDRSEERRVGKECVSKFRVRGSQY